MSTLRLQYALTELAYLRDGQIRGIYDEGTADRERMLVERAKALRTAAISDPRGLKVKRPRWRRAKPVTYGVPNHPAPAGASGNWPVSAGSPQAGVGRSVVDPTWGPPRN